MSRGLLDKITDFFWTEETITETQPELSVVRQRDKVAHLRVPNVKQVPAVDLKVVIVSPMAYDDVTIYADYLKANISLIINFDSLQQETQQSILDFLNGVCYVTGCSVERIAEKMFIYVPASVVIDREIFGYSIPPYVKIK